MDDYLLVGNKDKEDSELGEGDSEKALKIQEESVQNEQNEKEISTHKNIVSNISD